MIRDKRLLALAAGLPGCIFFTAMFLVIMDAPIWAINFSLVLGALAGTGTYWFKDKQERESIKQTVEEKT